MVSFQTTNFILKYSHTELLNVSFMEFKNYLFNLVCETIDKPRSIYSVTKQNMSEKYAINIYK